MVFCPKCGAENQKNAKYCQSCGTNLPIEKFKGEFTGDKFLNTLIWMFIAAILGEMYAIITLPICIILINIFMGV